MSASDNFAADLLSWHVQHGRHDLPWQDSPPDPYRVWLSEIMLQQTQVATVIPYFKRFIQNFPSLQALAAAREQQVLALWSGLGYYARARNLLACARRLVAQHGGQFPARAKDLEQLPGIGPSTAAAIAATVFQERAAILDGNVKRVLARLTCAPQAWASPALSKALLQEAQRRLPQSPAQMPAYTQAIMDLGAMICRAQSPACGQCPVKAHCCAFQKNKTAAFPVRSPKRPIPSRQMYWCVMAHEAGVWLEQQPATGIWGGLWTPWRVEPDRLPAGWSKMAADIDHVTELRHVLTHLRLEISVGVFRRTELPPQTQAELQRFLWPQVFELPLPTPARRLLQSLRPSFDQTKKRP